MHGRFHAVQLVEVFVTLDFVVKSFALLRQIVHFAFFSIVLRRSRPELLCHPPYLLTGGGKVEVALTPEAQQKEKKN